VQLVARHDPTKVPGPHVGRHIASVLFNDERFSDDPPLNDERFSDDPPLNV
jgi:hypothetical protein